MEKHGDLPGDLVPALAAVAVLVLVLMLDVVPKAHAATASQWTTPLEIDFGPVGVGTSAPQMIVTITNSGDTPLTGWAGGAVPSPFNASQDCNIQGGVLPGHSCHYFFDFAPTAAGTFSATSKSSTNAGQIQIIVHGTGVGAQASYDFHALDFGSVLTLRGSTGSSPTQTVTITNTGLAPLTDWTGGAVPAPFNASQDCNIPGGVLPGHSCHYFFDFSTATTGSFSATSNSTTNGGTITVAVAGSARSLLFGGGQWITPRSVDFGPIGVGGTAQLEVAVTNQGIENITGWAGGAVPAPFNGSQDCNVAGGLGPGGTCHFFYTFSPTTAGSFSATSNVSDNFGSFSIALHGTGVAPSMTADSLWIDFGPVAPDPSSPPQQVVTITNTGRSPLTGWAGGAVPAPFNGSQDCNIPGGVLPGHRCHFFYSFSPTDGGLFSATSTFSTNAGSISIKMQGAGTCDVRPARPALKSPRDGSISTRRRQKLRWRAAACAATYNVTVKDAASGKRVYSVKGLTILKQKTTPLIAHRTYKWFVQACDAAGCRTSPVETFSIE